MQSISQWACNRTWASRITVLSAPVVISNLRSIAHCPRATGTGFRNRSAVPSPSVSSRSTNNWLNQPNDPHPT